MMLSLLLALVLILASQYSTNSQAGPENPTVITPGKVIPQVQCAANPDQSYALFVPSSYSPGRPLPLVISSDPDARGSDPLELQKDAAEQFGYVLVASNNSRNGPWKPRFEATNATLLDVQKRVPIDLHRIYFAGFSGGARASVQLAILCKCAAGVFLDGAGFPGGQSPPSDSPFPVFSTVGILDFNYGEVIQLQDALTTAGYPHWLRIFDGTHQWAPAPVMTEAFAWFRIEAMKAQREPRDQSFIDAQFEKSKAHANLLEQSGDPLNAWRDYLQIASTYDSLEDTKAIRATADALGKDKSVREALKRERNEFAEQSSLTADIANAISGPDSPATPSVEDPSSVKGEILHLRRMADEEKRPEKARVYKRAVLQVFIMAAEVGSNFLDAKSYDRAVEAFDAAAAARPDSEWAWRQLAVANAYSGHSKQALAALRQAQQLSHDTPSFEKWLNTEPAFDRLRPTPEFRSLLGPS
jgi:tetratricopeptide (TPR) repeat protein